MSLITVSDVEAYLGVSFDSADSAVYQSVIDAVSKWIESYCDTKFTDAVYNQRISIIDNYFHLKNPLQYFISANYGDVCPITVTAPSKMCSVRIEEDVNTLKLVEGFLITDIDISDIALSEVVTAINSESGWSAVLEDDIDDDYAVTLYPGFYRANPNDSNKIELVSAQNPINLSQVSRNLFQTAQECSEGMVTYQGGFATVPADLKDACIRMVIKAYGLRQGATDKKSEKIGDYSYTNYTEAEMTGAGGGIAIDYYSVLNSYKINIGI